MKQQNSAVDLRSWLDLMSCSQGWLNKCQAPQGGLGGRLFMVTPALEPLLALDGRLRIPNLILQQTSLKLLNSKSLWCSWPNQLPAFTNSTLNALLSLTWEPWESSQLTHSASQERNPLYSSNVTLFPPFRRKLSSVSPTSSQHCFTVWRYCHCLVCVLYHRSSLQTCSCLGCLTTGMEQNRYLNLITEE